MKAKIIINQTIMKNLVSLLLVLGSAVAFGQNASQADADSLMKKFYDLYGISVSAPDNYNVSVNSINWKNSDATIGWIFELVAESGDGQCAILYPTFVPRLIEEGVASSVDGFMGNINREVLQSFGIIDEDLKFKTNEPASYTPSSYLTFVSGREVKDSFNVDKVCYYSIPYKEHMCYNSSMHRKLSFDPEKYAYATRVFFLKEGGYHFDILMLFTEEAFKQKGKYFSELPGTIVFDDRKVRETWELIKP